MTTTGPHQALYRRWRAQTFSQIVGQEAVVETLRNAVRTERVSHALLFVGPRGTGKTSLARIVAKAVNCIDLRDGDPCDTCDACIAIREGTTLDVLEIDAASNRGINEVRELRDRLAYPPGHLRRKVYILDEAHQITKDAWNALLKSLEEPPPFVIFMFASTEPSGFPPAILSRLQRYDVRRLTVPEIEGKLGRILESDGRLAEPEAVTLIARLAAGGMRDAESILDQLLATAADTISEGTVRDLLGLADAAAIDGFLEALLGGDPGPGIEILDRLEERGRDARAFLDQVVDAVRLRLVRATSDPVAGERRALADVARRLVAIDPDRAGIGGLRLQLELALFEGPVAIGRPVEPPARPHDEHPPMAAPKAPPADDPHRAGKSSLPAPEEGPVADPRRSAPVSPIPAARDDATGDSRAAARIAPEPPPAQARPTPADDAPAEPASDAVQPSTAATSSAGPRPSGPGTHDRPETGPATAEGPDTGRPAATGDLDRLVRDWATIVAAVRPVTRALLSECRPIAVEGNSVTLGFPEAKGFLKDHAERRRADLETAIGGHLGRDVTVRTVATNIEIATPAGGDDLIAQARRIFAEDLVDAGEIS